MSFGFLLKTFERSLREVGFISELIAVPDAGLGYVEIHYGLDAIMTR